MLFFALYRVFESMESLSSDSPTETDGVRNSPSTAKVSVFAQTANRTQNLPLGTIYYYYYYVRGLYRQVGLIYTISQRA